jgi:hypothetical protein
VLSTIVALFSWRFFFRSRLKAKDVALTALARSKDHIIEEKTATIERLDSHLKLMAAAANRGASVRNQEQQAPEATSQFRNVDDFCRTYDNVMLREIEANIRKLAAEYRPGDEREGYLVRTSATVIVLALFEYTWWNIFQSQINTLEALNTKVMHVDDLNAFYEEGKARAPICICR